MFSRRRRWSYLSITCILCLWVIPLFLLYAKDIQVVLSVKHNKRNGGIFQKNLDDDDDVGSVVVVDNKQASQHDVVDVLNHHHHQKSNFPFEMENEKSTIPQHVIGESGSSNARQEQQQTRLANYEKLVGNRDKRLPGELGQGVIVNGSVADKETEKIGYKRHAFNQLVSDRISLFRTLQDYRNQK